MRTLSTGIDDAMIVVEISAAPHTIRSYPSSGGNVNAKAFKKVVEMTRAYKWHHEYP
jgi:hypothetical protein